MEQLQPALRMLALTLPLGLSRDDDAPPTVTSSAVRVLGVYCTFSCLREDKAFLQDSGVAIIHALASSSQLVRVQASWALANLTDTLLAGTSRTLSSYFSAARNALKDKDVVKCNAVRAIGNLLKTVPQLDDKEVSSVCMQLAQCTSSGTMKLRWNACYACYSIFCSSFSAKYHTATVSSPVAFIPRNNTLLQDLLLNALCETACTCHNFKVCTHASLALGSLPSYTPAQLERVWSATLTSLEQSLQHEDFAEFRQAANLRSQLCRSLCRVLCVQTDLNAVPSHPVSGPAMACLTDCLNSAPKEDRAVLEAAERKLSSWPTAVESNPTLAGILSVLQSSLSRD
jgi:hypothetical protein